MPGTNAFASNYPGNEGGQMNTVQYLREQAARAERLARMASDSLTTERLQQAAKDYLLPRPSNSQPASKFANARRLRRIVSPHSPERFRFHVRHRCRRHPQGLTVPRVTALASAKRFCRSVGGREVV
jgi:hypothetical protein